MNDDDFFGVPVKKHNELDEVIVPASISPKANAQEKAPPIPVVAASVAAPPAAAAVASGPAQLYQEQLKAVADRTSQGDQATREREERQRKQAQAYLAEQIALRESRVKVIKTDHVKQQAAVRLQLLRQVSQVPPSGA